MFNRHHAGWQLAALSWTLLLVLPALAHGQAVTAAWDPSPSADQVTGYQVCVGTSSLSCNVALAPVGASTTTYRFTPAGGTFYYVATRATNASGASPYSSEVRFSIPSFTQPANQSSSTGTAITPVNLSITDPDGSAITITQTGLPLGLSLNSSTRQITGIPLTVGTHNVTLFVNDGLVNVARSFTWTVTQGAVTDQMRFSADFDGDGQADSWRYQRSNSLGTWRIRISTTGTLFSHQWGYDGDIPVPADYDGDGRADIAVYRPSTGQWWIMKLTTAFTYASASVYHWGMNGDIPVPADYDGDGRANMAVYRPLTGTWWILKLSASNTYAGAMVHPWGFDGDIPVPADYDGDGRADIAVQRPSTGYWWILTSTTNYNYQQATLRWWGMTGDIPVPADYDGDGWADMALYRPSAGQWHILKSSTNYSAAMIHQWGVNADAPTPADYDGDGRADIAVWRASEGRSYILRSGTNFTTWTWYRWQ